MKKPARAFHPRVVLVKTLYDSNIGASSRAMANMGVEDLILINPQCEITYAAQQAAATGQKALQTRRTYADWESFHKHEPEGLRIAFTARDGRGRLVRDFATTLQELVSADPRWSRANENAIPVYLIFGAEDAGLAAEDLEETHHACSIPTFGDNPSLNLAQAVLIALFILRTEWGGKQFTYSERGPDSAPRTDQPFPEESLREFLTSMGLSLDSKRVNAYTTFRRFLLRTVPTTKELRVMEIIFRQAARKLRARQTDQ